MVSPARTMIDIRNNDAPNGQVLSAETACMPEVPLRANSHCGHLAGFKLQPSLLLPLPPHQAQPPSSRPQRRPHTAAVSGVRSSVAHPPSPGAALRPVSLAARSAAPASNSRAVPALAPAAATDTTTPSAARLRPAVHPATSTARRCAKYTRLGGVY